MVHSSSIPLVKNSETAYKKVRLGTPFVPCGVDLLHNNVSLPRLFNLIGFSHPKARYFLLLRQKKVSKEKAARIPLVSSVPRFRRGLPEGTSVYLWQRAASMPHPCGLIPSKTPVLGAANGSNPIPSANSSHCLSRVSNFKCVGWARFLCPRGFDALQKNYVVVPSKTSALGVANGESLYLGKSTAFCIHGYTRRIE
jgi:hypothetical protein